MAELDLRYLAGVIDSVALLRKREVRDSGLLPAVAVHGIEPVIRMLAKATGTHPTTTNRDYHAALCVEHCSQPHIHKVSSSLRWSLTGARATVLLAAIEPFTVMHQHDITLAVEEGLEQRWTVPPVKSMHSLGWPIPQAWLPEYLLRTKQAEIVRA